MGFLELYSGFQIPQLKFSGFRIPQAKISRNLDSLKWGDSGKDKFKVFFGGGGWGGGGAHNVHYGCVSGKFNFVNVVRVPMSQ